MRDEYSADNRVISDKSTSLKILTKIQIYLLVYPRPRLLEDHPVPPQGLLEGGKKPLPRVRPSTCPQLWVFLLFLPTSLFHFPFHLFFVYLTATRYTHTPHHVELTSFPASPFCVLSPIEPPSSSTNSRVALIPSLVRIRLRGRKSGLRARSV